MSTSPNTSDFAAWLDTAATGAVLVYYTGFLARDRIDQINNQTKQLDRPKVPGLDELAAAVHAAADAGKVALFQRRLNRDRFEYLAVRVANGIACRDRLPLTADTAGRVRKQALAA